MTAPLRTYENEDGRIMVETRKGVVVSLGAAVQLGIISTAEHAAILNSRIAARGPNAVLRQAERRERPAR